MSSTVLCLNLVILHDSLTTVNKAKVKMHMIIEHRSVIGNRPDPDSEEGK